MSETLEGLSERIPTLLAMAERWIAVKEELDPLLGAHVSLTKQLAEVEAACATGMRLSLPAREIVARIRATLTEPSS